MGYTKDGRLDTSILMVSAADKPAETDLLWEKNIILWLISSSEQGHDLAKERVAEEFSKPYWKCN